MGKGWVLFCLFVFFFDEFGSLKPCLKDGTLAVCPARLPSLLLSALPPGGAVLMSLPEKHLLPPQMDASLFNTISRSAVSDSLPSHGL